jgi:hypothetical protein
MRPEFLLTTLLLCGSLVILRGGRALPRAAVVLAAALLVLLPWTLRAHQSLSAVNRANAGRLPRPLPEWVLVSAGGPLNFATANSAYSSGVFDTRLIERLVPGRAALELDLAHAEVNRLFIDGYAIGLRWLFTHPGEALALMGRKIAYASDALALGYLRGNLPAGLSGERRPVDQFAPRGKTLRWAHLALGLFGAWTLRGAVRDRGSRATAWMLGAYGLTTLVTILAFFGYVRFGMLLAPLFWVLYGAGSAALAARVRWPAPLRVAPGRALAGLVGLLLLVEALAAAAGPQSYSLSGSYLPGTQRINPDDRVLIAPRAGP